jgi:hypothetical protein
MFVTAKAGIKHQSINIYYIFYAFQLYGQVVLKGR